MGELQSIGGIALPTFEDRLVFVLCRLWFIENSKFCHFCRGLFVVCLAFVDIKMRNDEVGWRAYTLSRGFELSLDVQSERMGSLCDVCSHMGSFWIETSTVETGQADIDPERLILQNGEEESSQTQGDAESRSDTNLIIETLGTFFSMNRLGQSRRL